MQRNDPCPFSGRTSGKTITSAIGKMPKRRWIKRLAGLRDAMYSKKLTRSFVAETVQKLIIGSMRAFIMTTREHRARRIITLFAFRETKFHIKTSCASSGIFARIFGTEFSRQQFSQLTPKVMLRYNLFF